MSEELQSGPVIIPLSAYNVGFGGGVSEEEVNELIENSLDNIKDQIDELSANAGGSIEGVTTVYETALGYNTHGECGGVAIGICTDGSYMGTAVGYGANGSINGTAVGYGANGLCGALAIGYKAESSPDGVAIGYETDAGSRGVAIGYKAESLDNGVAIGYGAVTYNSDTIAIGIAAEADCSYPIHITATASADLKVSKDGKLYINDKEIGGGSSGGVSSNIEGVTTTGETSIGVNANGLDGGVAIGYNANANELGVAVGKFGRGIYNGTAVGYCADGYNYGTAIGKEANGSTKGVAIGYRANGYCTGTAIGNKATGTFGTVAIGYCANATNNTPIVINAINGSGTNPVTLKVTNDGKLLVNGNEIGSGGSGSSIDGFTGYGDTAIGMEANACGYSTVLGYNTFGSAGGTVIGTCAAGSDGGIAIGYKAGAASNTVAIGSDVTACDGTPIVIKAKNGDVTLAVTYEGKLLVNGNEIGAGSGGSINLESELKQLDPIAIGLGAEANSSYPIHITARASSTDLKVSKDGKLYINDVEIGSGSSIIGVTNCANTAIGKGATVCTNSTSIGYNAAGGRNSIVIGYNANVAPWSVAIGATACAGDNAVAIGYNANSLNRSVAIGYDTNANYGTVAIGYEAKGCGSTRINIKATNSCNNGDVTLAVTDDGKLLINDNIVAFMSAISALQTCIDGLKSRLNALETA